ncbi:hypothetical protein BBF96_03800 [Anoxybacter fermentans]|uniref:Uncharacterized protein n=1 Tax=Anoxybacter fermentans TaxID=1323375 RepID=A0A3S9SW95_9FIRM|nr:hypothetical protein BBF96_03800 [Anoxybacter fermentans]
MAERLVVEEIIFSFLFLCGSKLCVPPLFQQPEIAWFIKDHAVFFWIISGFYDKIKSKSGYS